MFVRVGVKLFSCVLLLFIWVKQSEVSYVFTNALRGAGVKWIRVCCFGPTGFVLSRHRLRI